jgi:hypothetical protein
MKARLVGLAAAIVTLGLAGSSAKAQDAGFSDPFYLYYSFFLPRQSALAAQSQPEDFYRAQSVQRQYTSQTDRAGLYEPNSSIGLDELDPMRPFGRSTSPTRMVRTNPAGLVSSINRSNHAAPAGYYASHRNYFPGIRSGVGAGRRMSSPGAGPVGSVGRNLTPSPYQGLPPGVRMPTTGTGR